MIEKTLAELTLNITDGKHGDCRGKDDSGFFFISCKDVRDGQIHYEDARQIVEEDFWDTHKRTRLEPDDILVTNSGTIGRMAFIRDVPLTYRTTFQKSVAIVKPDKSKILPKYLYYQLQNCVGSFVNQSNGAAQKNLLLSTMRAFKMNIHEDEDTQIRIASILSAYDDLIENNQKQIKLLEEAAQRLYKEWFVDLRFPGHETTPITDGIPEGWQQLLLEQVAPILTGKKDANFSTEDGQYPFFTCAQTPLQAPSYSFDCDAVILAGNGDFNVKLYRGQFEAYQRTYVLSPENTKLLFLLYHAVNNSMAKLAQGASGSTIKFLTKGMIASIPVYVPDERTLSKFNELSEAIQKQVEVLKNTIAHATEARDRLLPQLMNGEIEV